MSWSKTRYIRDRVDQRICRVDDVEANKNFSRVVRSFHLSEEIEDYIKMISEEEKLYFIFHFSIHSHSNGEQTTREEISWRRKLLLFSSTFPSVFTPQIPKMARVCWLSILRWEFAHVFLTFVHSINLSPINAWKLLRLRHIRRLIKWICWNNKQQRMRDNFRRCSEAWKGSGDKSRTMRKGEEKAKN